MIVAALKGLAGRKLRSALTAFAVVLGVALVSGTYVLTDTISTAFDAIFQQVYKNTDVAITPHTLFGTDQQGGSPPSFPQTVLVRVRSLPEVGVATGNVASQSTLIIGKNGKALVFGGAPNLGFSIDIAKSALNPLELVEGAWPHGKQVVIDGTAARKGGYHVGDTIGIQAEGPVERMRLAGIVRFGAAHGIGGATLAGFDLATAQRLFHKQGKLDEIDVEARKGVSPQQLTSRLRAVLPPSLDVRTGQAQADENASDTNQGISVLQNFLLAFGGIALFVGSFVIANSLSITIAQRTREFATLRTLGATRRQVLGSIIVEALVLGVVASVAGLFLGLALAKGLSALFDLIGFTLPKSGLVLQGRTVIVSLAVGILVTLVASLRPALRATRVPPIAAVREGATLAPTRFARFRTLGAVVVTALGFALLAYGLFAAHGTTAVLLAMGAGAVLIFIGVSLFAQRIVIPLAAVAGPIATVAVPLLAVLIWPVLLLPFWLLRYGAFGRGTVARRTGAFVLGAVLNPLLLVIVLIMAGRHALTGWQPDPPEFPNILPDRQMNGLAAENSKRNTQRTASTAAALMIGLALVTLVAVLANGIIASFTGAVNEIFTADYAITAQNNFSPLPTSIGDAAARADGVETAASVRASAARIFGKTEGVTAVDPHADRVLALKWTEGSQSVLSNLGADGAFTDDGYAKSHNLHVGSPIELT
ncbi:MAG: putative transport system permease protein, partial [Gaiellaceae bacterium]|nr:putative transport system permease protein [Gaiellaceae bacterium]